MILLIYKNYKNDYILYIIGHIADSIYYNKILSYIKTNNLAGKTQIITNCNNVSVYYPLADVVILPSLYEGFSNVLLECMMFKKLLFLSNEANTSSIIKHNYNGILFDCHDHIQLSRYLHEYITDPTSYKVHTSRLFKQLSEYRIESIVKKYLYYYRKILAYQKYISF